MANEYILSPVGRMVQGNPFEAQTTNMQGGPLMNTKGEPKIQYFFAVAFPKNQTAGTLIASTGERSAVDILAYCQQLAAAAWPAGAYKLPTFSWKIQDGDAVPADGTAREGFAGCWVFKFTSGFPVQVVAEDPAQVLTDPAALRRGYFVRVLFQYAGNGQTTKPGMYLNAYKVQRVAYGEEITSGPSAADVFGAPAGSLPAGASVTPPAPAVGPAAPAPGPAVAAGPFGPQGPAQAPGPLAAAPAPTALQPARDFLHPGAPVGPAGGVPSAPAPAPAPPAPAGLEMTPKAGGATLEAFKTQGWTEEAMIAQGYAARI